MAFPINNLLFFTFAKNRFQGLGFDAPEATRRALPVLIVKPAIWGFVLSFAFSQNRAAAAPSPVVNTPAAGGVPAAGVPAAPSSAAHGHQILGGAGVPARERYFPSFKDLSPQAAHDQARQLGIHIDTIHRADIENLINPVVDTQDPEAGVKRQTGMDSVKLTFRSKPSY